MTTQTSESYAVPNTDNSRLLRGVLRANGIFSASSGLLFLIASGQLAEMLGIGAPWIVSLLGAGLVIFGGVLLFIAARNYVTVSVGIVVVALDLLWVAGSVLLLLGGLLPMTTAGRWLVAIVADIVLVFAILQIIGVRRLRRG